MSSSGDSIARKLTLGSYFSNRRKARLKRRSTESKKMTTVKRSSSTSSGSGTSKTTTGGGTKPKFTKADLVAFNKLPDKVRKASKKKIAAFQAAGVGVFEDYSVHTSGKGFGKFFDKTSPEYKNRKK